MDFVNTLSATIGKEPFNAFVVLLFWDESYPLSRGDGTWLTWKMHMLGYCLLKSWRNVVHSAKLHLLNKFFSERFLLLPFRHF